MSEPTTSQQPAAYTYTPPAGLPSQPPQTQPQTTQPSTSRPAAGSEDHVDQDETLAKFMLMLDEYEPLIPNEVTDYYLQRVGFECDDVRLKRLLSLAAQKFVSDIAADAYQHARIRHNASVGRSRAYAGAKDKTRTTLTMEDLSLALAEYGINARKPEFYL